MEAHLIAQSVKLAAMQDGGRFGYEQYGVSVNGAVDGYAYLMGNVLVGNASPEPSIEITAFNFTMTSTVDVLICVTGATADLTIDSIPIDCWKTTVLPAGKLLSVKKIRQGLRVYIAIGGGIDVPLTLGSCSPDTVGQIGQKLSSGQQLRLKDPQISLDYLNRAVEPQDKPTYGSPWNIRICDGPDVGIFGNNLDLFLQTAYKVSPNSNHIGIRLEGPPLLDFYPREVLSRGVGIGAIEIVPSGHPIIFHRGRGVTAGYPIIASVCSADLGMVGQARPGDTIRFSRITVDEAVQLYRDQCSRILLTSSQKK